jgi:hypothetical protein
MALKMGAQQFSYVKLWMYDEQIPWWTQYSQKLNIFKYHTFYYKNQ